MAFIELFAHSARVNALAGRRPGAHLAVLRADHPDIVDFVRARSRNPEAFAGVGFAVAVPDDTGHAMRGTLAGAALPFAIGLGYLLLHRFTGKEE